MMADPEESCDERGEPAQLPKVFSTRAPIKEGFSLLREEPGWWRQESTEFLIDVLTCVNNSRQRRSSADRREDLVCALELMVNAEIQRREKPGLLPETCVPIDFDSDQFDATIAVYELEEFIDQVFESPSQRLAVYGSLRPGESNEGQLAGIAGQWLDGVVHGIVRQPGEYLEFTWSANEDLVPVKVFVAPELSKHFHRLDEFEGPDYRRSLVPVEIDGVIQICNIYEGRSKNPS